jgi:hypothetical protein
VRERDPVREQDPQCGQDRDQEQDRDRDRELKRNGGIHREELDDTSRCVLGCARWWPITVAGGHCQKREAISRKPES